jgi:PAS domain S-box-containing protein
MKPSLKEILRFKIDEESFSIRIEQINSRLSLYPRMILSQLAIAFLLVVIMWNGVDHNILLGWLTLVYGVHLVEFLYWLRLHKHANNIEQCRQWNIIFCWLSGVVATVWGIGSLMLFVPDQFLYQMFLIAVLLGISAGAATSNPVHPPSLYIYFAGLVLPITLRVFWEADLPHLILGIMLVIYIGYVISSVKELTSTFELSLRQRIENEKLLNKLIAQQAFTEAAKLEAESNNAAFRESEALLKESQTIAGLGSYVFNFAVRQWSSSEALDEIFGIDKAYDRSFEKWVDLIHPDERNKMLDYFTNDIAGKGKSFDKEYRIVRQNDQAIRWVHGIGKLDFDQNNRPVKLHGTIQDITERKQAEIALHESEEKYRGLFENAGDLAYGTDLNGVFSAVSESLLKVTGYNRNELINSSIAKILTPDNLALARQMTSAKLDSNMPVTRYELEITDKSGKQIPLELVSTLTYMNGVPIGVQGLGRDISERKRGELALQESIRKLEEKELAKTRFLAAAGHDLRQPLAAASLFIDALKFTQPRPDQNQIIQRLDQAMNNFNGLLDALLNVSKLDAGMIKPEYALINVTDIFEWLEQSFAPMVSEKQIRFKLHFPMKKRLAVRTDIGLLNSVLMNLVSNAIKFTSSGGILVSARQRDAELLFQVWDTGIGISDENIHFIFDEFFQINNPQRDRTRGLGLGLSIAKRALALFDGKITCRSQVGKGSVFEFRLPLADTSDEEPHSANTTIPQVFDQISSIQGKRFVVVEDDALVAEALSNALVGIGANVDIYHRAEVALNLPSIGDADYFIVDYMIGGALNGIQFLEQLRQRLDKPVKAVIMTGETSSAFVREAANCEWPVVHKPVNISKLIEALQAQVN